MNGRPQLVNVQTRPLESRADAWSLPQLYVVSPKYSSRPRTTCLMSLMREGNSRRNGCGARFPGCENPSLVKVEIVASKVPVRKCSSKKQGVFIAFTPNKDVALGIKGMKRPVIRISAEGTTMEKKTYIPPETMLTIRAPGILSWVGNGTPPLMLHLGNFVPRPSLPWVFSLQGSE